MSDVGCAVQDGVVFTGDDPLPLPLPLPPPDMSFDMSWPSTEPSCECPESSAIPLPPRPGAFFAMHSPGIEFTQTPVTAEPGSAHEIEGHGVHVCCGRGPRLPGAQ